MFINKIFGLYYNLQGWDIVDITIAHGGGGGNVFLFLFYKLLKIIRRDWLLLQLSVEKKIIILMYIKLNNFKYYGKMIKKNYYLYQTKKDFIIFYYEIVRL